MKRQNKIEKFPKKIEIFLLNLLCSEILTGHVQVLFYYFMYQIIQGSGGVTAAKVKWFAQKGCS